MTKAELIEAVHAAAGEGLTRKATADLVDSIFAQMRTPALGERRLSSISGVCPIAWTMSP